MAERLIHIARGEVELGAFQLPEVHELLDAGFLKPSDDCWTPGMSEWRPLGETLPRLSASGPNADWRDLLVASSAALSGFVGRHVGKFVADVKANAAAGQDPLPSMKRSALQQHLPKLQKLMAANLQGKPATVVRAAMQDEQVMQKLFGTLYHCLPRAICRFVPETAFVNFCLENRQTLMSVAEPSSPPTPPKTPPGAPQ